MKPFFCLLIFFLFLPTTGLLSIVGLRTGSAEFVPTTLQALAAPDGGPESRVRVEGFLIRLGSPKQIRDGKDYVFPFVDRETADRTVAEGQFAFSGPGLPVVATVQGASLPVEAFARPPAGTSEPRAIPYVLEGVRRVRSLKPSSRIARITGLMNGAEMVLLDGTVASISRFEGIVYGIAALFFLALGVKLFRSWRRDRREALEQTRRRMERYQAERRARSGGAPTDTGAKATAPASVTQVRPRLGWQIPWSKIAGVLIILGIAGARLGKSVAPAADNVARGVARSADEVASAARGAGKAASDLPPATGRTLELPSPGDLALEAAGQIPNVKTATDAVKNLKPGDAGKPDPGRRSSERVDLTLTVVDSMEVYEPMEWPEVDAVLPGLLTYELTKIRSVEQVEGKISGMPRVQRTQTSRDLPDRDAGEFTRVFLQEIDGGVRLTQVLSFADKDGYVEVARAGGDMRFVGGGTWAALLGGDGPLLLEFTEEGTAEYARKAETLMARAMEVSLAKQGMGGLTVESHYRQPPIQELSFEKGKLTLRQRGKSVLDLRGRYR
ncbi:hypothetical protein [Planctomycetes bacterium Poly30]|uniref:hypothetical protein n=1 Tax=Saltatorellus ferox TaxID=2528018 RepID=UPI0011A6ABC0